MRGGDLVRHIQRPGEGPLDPERVILMRQLSRLPRQQQACIWLGLSDWTNDEIARVLGLTENRVLQLRYRGMKKIRKQLQRATPSW